MFAAFRREIVINQSINDELMRSNNEHGQNWLNYKLDVPEILRITEYNINLEDLTDVYQIMQNSNS